MERKYSLVQNATPGAHNEIVIDLAEDDLVEVNSMPEVEVIDLTVDMDEQDEANVEDVGEVSDVEVLHLADEEETPEETNITSQRLNYLQELKRRTSACRKALDRYYRAKEEAKAALDELEDYAGLP